MEYEFVPERAWVHQVNLSTYAKLALGDFTELRQVDQVSLIQSAEFTIGYI
jgi:hypothetical protein